MGGATWKGEEEVAWGGRLFGETAPDVVLQGLLPVCGGSGGGVGELQVQRKPNCFGSSG